MGGTVLCPCQPVYLFPAAPLAPALSATLESAAKLPRTPPVTQTTHVPTRVSVPCCHLSSTSVSAPEDGQVRAASMRTAVSPVPVLTEEGAALCLVAATPVLVLPATKVHAALMTQMNVQTHPLPARMEARVSTPLALTSVSVKQGSRASTVRVHTSPAHLHPV